MADVVCTSSKIKRKKKRKLIGEPSGEACEDRRRGSLVAKVRLSKRWGRGWRLVVGQFKLGQARAADVYADADAPTCRRPRAPELRDAPPFALECPVLYMLICHELQRAVARVD